METPSSTRRVTRSQTRAAAAAAKIEESEKSTRMKSRQGDRSALVDITNDSPIVGLAMQSLKTPSSVSAAVSKKKRMGGRGRTPGSGEALLRGQVKALLQKVEEERCNSPISPDFLNLAVDSCADGDASCLPFLTPSIVFPQMMIKEGRIESEDRITRSLLLDFSEKSSDSSSSSDASEVCSVKVDDEAGLDELCEGIRKISVGEFEGKHTRFVYDSDDDEIVCVSDECSSSTSLSVGGGGVLRLKGLPTPKGKHIRFVQQRDN